MNDEPFAGIFKESNIFAQRDVLSPHYIPEHLLFRDAQINEIVKAVTPTLRGERGRNLFIYGKTGTGKTSCIKHVIAKIKELSEVRARISYINCRIYNSRYRVLNKITSDHMPLYAKRGYGIIDIYERIINWIEEDGKILIVVLDEIDSVKDLDDLIYTLSRANSDIKSGGVAIVGISNNVGFKEDLDPRSRSTLYEKELVFPPYNSTELSTILKERSERGFKKERIDAAALNLAAAIAANESGDARLALMIISKAGEIAEAKGAEKVTQDFVREASKEAEDEMAYQLVNTLPEHQKLIVYAIALLSLQGSRYKKLTEGSDTYIFSGEVYSKYSGISESMHREPKSSRWYRKYITDLEMQGLIQTYESGKGIRGHTKLIKLAYPPEKIKSTIEKALFKDNEGGEGGAVQDR
ncbi:MAG: AAA family ATPase [Candidatus Marsarchaeota archaeon]|jgi:cell division control protein 6|nr:AAA family ATPase [Candidatus Marsarchaeota archaeon]MCL5419437.1 AAA family ATPase [Candidatus Marsarchaeota archaeon]